ncbi:MAG: phospholipase D-like domain-containing protein [Proteobacteria bacterium]|nr:phospholipase D-like domain-containing protein [Pseudomonadota bacterium]
MPNPFIFDNSNKTSQLARHLHGLVGGSQQLDIATSYFEIGALLELNGEWQKTDKIRILMGGETSKRTAKLIAGNLPPRDVLGDIKNKLDASLVREKEENYFLDGVAAIAEALRGGKIECRVFKEQKFHAKAYIVHPQEVAVVGSSNFTKPGLRDNVELNIEVRGEKVALLQAWYEAYWEKAEDCTEDLLKVVRRHSREYKPFEVWVKALSEYLGGFEEAANAWEKNDSKIFPLLAPYQRTGYRNMLDICNQHRGAFLCDGVGLGKTFIGLMLIERFLKYEKTRPRVALFVPKSAKKAVWEHELEKYIPEVFNPYSRLPFDIFSHTDLSSPSQSKRLEFARDYADVIIIDEAHHFRNRGRKTKGRSGKKSRYFEMRDITRDKQVYMLTATPINNDILDFKHLIDLFTDEKADHFKSSLGVPNLPGHFLQMRKELEAETESNTLDLQLSKEFLRQDKIFPSLVIQRSRKYIKESLAKSTGAKTEILFPQRQPPKPADYSVASNYGTVLAAIEQTCKKKPRQTEEESPLFALSIYNPYVHYIGPDEELDEEIKNRHAQIVGLIRTGFLKRFESSVAAFYISCQTLMGKLLKWIEINAENDNEKDRLQEWKVKNLDLLKKHPLFGQQEEDEDGTDDSSMAPEAEEISYDRKLPRKKFDMPKIFKDAYSDLDNLKRFMEAIRSVPDNKDAKLDKLRLMLRTDPVLNQHKVIIFTEFRHTARYLHTRLKESGIEGVDVIDSDTSEDRANLITRFSPYYNGSSSEELRDSGKEEIRVLVSTDVLAEGLNLQDCTRIINYDIHWNPVRLMQRIGRIDRRLNPDIEARIKSDHPDTAELRGKVAFWNFLPPDEIDRLLSLYKIVAKKTLYISKVLGLEYHPFGGDKDDEHQPLRLFNEQYEGTFSHEEKLREELDDLYRDNPTLRQQVANYPNGIFSGRTAKHNKKGVFFCYGIPTRRASKIGDLFDENPDPWDLEKTVWYFYDSATGKISKDTLLTDAKEIAPHIRSQPRDARDCRMDKPSLKQIRQEVEDVIKNTHLRDMNAPNWVLPKLKCWMEVN